MSVPPPRDSFDTHVLAVLETFGSITPLPTCPEVGADGGLVCDPHFRMHVSGLYFGINYSLSVLGSPVDRNRVSVSLCFQRASVKPAPGSSFLSVETDRLAGFEQDEAVTKEMGRHEFTQAAMEQMFKLAAGVGSRLSLGGELWELMRRNGFEGGVSFVTHENGAHTAVVSGLERVGVFVKVAVSVDMAGVYSLRAESLGQVFFMRTCRMTPLIAAAREMVQMHVDLLRYPPAGLSADVYPDNLACPLLDALRARGFVSGRLVSEDPSEWVLVDVLCRGMALEVLFRPSVSASLYVNGLTVNCVFSQAASLEKTIDDFVGLAWATVDREISTIRAKLE